MKILRWLWVGAVTAVCCGNANAQIVVYENMAPDGWTDAYPVASTVPSGGSISDELGDQVVLDSGTPRTLASISIQYFAQNLTGSETVEVRFYEIDGALNDRGFPTPGTLLYGSGAVSLSQLNGRGVLTLDNLNVTVPDEFVWTAQFSGISGSKVAGLAIHGDPTVGSSFNDFWEKAGGVWDFYQFTSPPLPGSFGAEITVVPEPLASPFIFLTAALLGVAGVRYHRRR